MKLIPICLTTFLRSGFEVDVCERTCEGETIVKFQKSVVL